MFSGFGGAEFALRKANIEYECVGYSEIDKNAIKCYDQNFSGVKNYGDCSKIDPEQIPDFDLLTGGFPCQDVSLAGNRDLSKGRTNLYLEVLRIAKSKKPTYLLLENVKGLLSMETDEGMLVDKIIRDLKSIGYGVAWKVLNTKEYGIPQNRERIWFVCKYGGWEFMEFMFPEKVKLTILLADILEQEPDQKYYLKPHQVERIIERNQNFDMKGNRFIDSDKDYFSGLTCGQTQNDILISNSSPREIDFKTISPALLSRDYKDPKIIQLVGDRDNPSISIKSDVVNTISSNPMSDRVQIIVHNLQQRSEDRPSVVKVREQGLPDPGGCGHLSKDDGTTYCLDSGNTQAIEIMNCLTEAQGRQGSSKEFIRSCEILNQPLLLDLYNKSIKSDGISICLTEPHHNNLRIVNKGLFRRLTPRECFRLMGFHNDEINLEGLSDSAKYKLAGNGWDINVVSMIFKRLFKKGGNQE
jgi:DNA-cytosine methyltransferase